MADIVNNEYMKNLLKTVYEEGVINNKAQSSPVVSEMKKENWVGGKELAYSAQYLNGGNVGSNLSTIVAANNDSYKYAVPRNAEWKMTYGALTSFFDIDSPDLLASMDDKGAYMSILSNKMGAAFDLLGKNSAVYLYGGKYGVIEQLKTAIDIDKGDTPQTMTVSSSAGLKLQPGMRFQVASAGADNTAVPSSALLEPVLTVIAVDDSGDEAIITYTSSSSSGAHKTYVGDYIELFGARASNAAGAEAYGFEGLYDILPTVGDRTGSAWESYIKTPFRGINRSDYVTGLAGQFVKADASGATRKTDALVKLLKKTQRYGGLNDIIIINDDTLNDIYKELDSKAYLRQVADGATAGRKSATAGFSQFSTAFGDSFIDRVIRDPYAMNGHAYMLDKDDLTFKTISNAGKVFDAVGNGQLGKYDVKSFGDQGIGENVNAGTNYDKLFTIVSGNAPGTFDYQTRVITKLYGNFLLKKTGASGVAVLD